MMSTKSTLELTHISAKGEAQMVDVSNKIPTVRTARATARVILGPIAFPLVRDNMIKKGDVLSVARVAGIQAAKQTSTLIPLCHPVGITKVAVDAELVERGYEVMLTSEVKCKGETGVEMEALTAVSVAALTVYDMCKAVEKGIKIVGIELVSKTGGKSGDYLRKDAEGNHWEDESSRIG